jgi:gamma-glutamyltranspeptidase/glutathione hydrolase
MRSIVLPCLLLSCAVTAWAADPAPVGATRGMVVSAQHLASDVGADILAQGGNAVDAAVAVGYALAVVDPSAGNLGGGGFMTLRLADGRTDFLDFREKAPLAATPTMFLGPDGQPVPGASTRSWRAVGVPGSPLGLEAARVRYGSMSRARLMAPAIRLARDGFVLDPGDVALLRVASSMLGADPATAAIFQPGGAVPASGSRLRQPALARSLVAISAAGPEAAFYHGPIGAAVVAASTAGGGILAAQDFARYAVRWLPPVTCDYRGYHVISSPPPGSGGVTLCEMLNILQGYDLAADGFHSAAEVHVLVEAMRRAFHDRNFKLGDPAFVTNPTAALLDPAYAAKLRAGIDPERATPSISLAAAVPAAVKEGAQTTHYAVVDAAGNAVSVTYTLNGWFGIGRVAGDTGILMNNEMDDFSIKPGSANMFGLVQGDANAIAPGKTPLSSMTPTIVTKDGKLKLVIGSPGGPRIITAVLEAIVNLVDHGMNVQEAVDAPRIHAQWMPDTVAVEHFGLSADTRGILQRDGYTFKDGDSWALVEAILVGGPALGAPLPSPGALPMPPPYVAGATLFGAHDVRGPAGAARGVD